MKQDLNNLQFKLAISALLTAVSTIAFTATTYQMVMHDKVELAGVWALCMVAAAISIILLKTAIHKLPAATQWDLHYDTFINAAVIKKVPKMRVAELLVYLETFQKEGTAVERLDSADYFDVHVRSTTATNRKQSISAQMDKIDKALDKLEIPTVGTKVKKK